MAAETPAPKAFSYVRFSTPEQARGHSQQRQLDGVRAMAARDGFELDENLTFQDLGVSAFHGRNVETGALGHFLEGVRSGQIPKGSRLYVESLDRISRRTVRKAVRTMEVLIEEGVSIVDVSDDHVYSAETLDEDGGTAFLMMALRFMRAHEESVRKSARVAAAWESKRKTLVSGTAQTRPHTRMLPAWVRWDDASNAYRLIEERATIVRSIFEQADAGRGIDGIARGLNQSKTPTWGAGKRKGKFWRGSYVRKILNNPACVGTFTPCRSSVDSGTRRRVRTPLEPVPMFFPAVVGGELFERIEARMHATAARGRHAGHAASSIFAGVLKCARCGSSVVRVAKGKKNRPGLVCARAHAKGDCKHQSVRYDDVEEAIRNNIDGLIAEAPLGSATEALSDEIADAEHTLDELSDEVRTLTDELIREKSVALRERLKRAEQQFAEATKRLREKRDQRERLAAPFVKQRLETLREALVRRPCDIPETNRALKAAVTRIVMAPEGGELIVHWQHTETTARLRFLSRHDTTFKD